MTETSEFTPKEEIEKSITPQEVEAVYAAIDSKAIQSFDSGGLVLDDGTRVGTRIGGEPTSKEGVKLPGTETTFQVITEESMEDDTEVADGNVAISRGFFQCNAVIYQLNGETHMIHNTNKAPGLILRAKLISQLDKEADFSNIQQMRNRLDSKEDKKLLENAKPDRVIVIGDETDEMAEYFRSSDIEPEVVNVETGGNEPFDVWMKNDNGNVKYGVVS